MKENPNIFISYRFHTKDKSSGWGHCELLHPLPFTEEDIRIVEERLRAISDHEWVQVLFWQRYEI
jgi:hypothetical protein